MADFYGYNPPFLGGPQNVLSRQEDVQLIRNDLLQLLLTVPGERVMRPDFGTPLRAFVFEQSTEADIATLTAGIRTAIASFEPRVVVESLNVESRPNDNALDLRLVVRLRKNPRQLISIERIIAAPIDSR